MQMKIEVLDKGFIKYIDHMGSDERIVQAARTSYGKDEREHRIRGSQYLKEFAYIDHSKDSEELDKLYKEAERKAETEITNKDTDLIRYLMRHSHTTPFEMCEVTFLVQVPMDCWRQWIRHRTANVNEYSTRYSEALDMQQATPPEKWRLQAASNKQGSSGYLEAYHPGTKSYIDGEFLSNTERDFHEEARTIYQQRLEAGIAKEQARKDLPLSTYTRAYWKCDLHNIFNFLRLRMDSHAQEEIRLYANAMATIIKSLFPIAYKAFEDYQLNSLKLTALDIQVIRTKTLSNFTIEEILHNMIANKREREECLEKLKRLNLC